MNSSIFLVHVISNLISDFYFDKAISKIIDRLREEREEGEREGLREGGREEREILANEKLNGIRPNISSNFIEMEGRGEGGGRERGWGEIGGEV